MKVIQVKGQAGEHDHIWRLARTCRMVKNESIVKDLLGGYKLFS
jgi:hypothetical protein